MPVDINALRNHEARVEIEYVEGVTITIRYNPVKVAQAAFRHAWQERRRELQSEIGDWLKGLRDELRKVDLPDDLPGREALVAAGITNVGDVPDDLELLSAIEGISRARAYRIVMALRDIKGSADGTELAERTERMNAELAVMLATGWDLLDDGRPYPFTAENVAELQGLGMAICAAIWADVNALGNRRTSATTG